MVRRPRRVFGAPHTKTTPNLTHAGHNLNVAGGQINLRRFECGLSRDRRRPSESSGPSKWQPRSSQDVLGSKVAQIILFAEGFHESSAAQSAPTNKERYD